MSRHDKARFALLALAAVVIPALPARGQTIADYSRAQRMLLETAMTQAAARSASLGASAPAVAASTASSTPSPAARVPMPSVLPALQVSGVFASNAGAVAEVVVDATAYLLTAGQGVPGTPWHVESVAIDRVVLSRQDLPGPAVDSGGARKVFALPALR
jgi:type IV pilus biogenesis protein PilP